MEEVKYDEEGPVEFHLQANGPIFAKGKFKIIDSKGNVQELQEAYLCRCGRSQNKPFCDGSHNR
ncbi:MAG: CDGSH iron-sulfur domain-containing protein [Bacteroidales bacterium]|nr:CDGSH iron-sulfur domain-containing protein [Bacteroidales bacterium]HOK97714.1 CDGSH iron-sulfur domain-containing protein [Bacteroidales bacterium]HPO65781.1 CDGSH iron-sulfur domain-containing protein [Bacteroidales bacterium]